MPVKFSRHISKIFHPLQLRCVNDPDSGHQITNPVAEKLHIYKFGQLDKKNLISLPSLLAEGQPGATSYLFCISCSAVKGKSYE